jgi:hypothetical protein
MPPTKNRRKEGRTVPIARRTGDDDLMNDLPHVIAGADRPTEELVRIVEAYCREYGLPTIGLRLRADLCNKAIDWWNALQPDQREEPTS